jgi:hypothetical protein
MKTIRLRRPPPSEVFLPFGRHRGEPIADAPPGYLWWCLLNLDELSPTVERAMWAALAARMSDRTVVAGVDYGVAVTF